MWRQWTLLLGALGAAWISAAQVHDDRSDVIKASEPIDHLADWSALPKFIVLLGTSPAAAASPSMPDGLSRTQRMVTSSGRVFTCTMPIVANETAASTPDINAAAPAAAVESPQTAIQSIEEQRTQAMQAWKAVISGVCASIQEGYWTFELCPFRSAHQYHPSAEQVVHEFDLGDFQKQSWTDKGAYVQTFAGGDDGRNVRAVFSCPEVRGNELIIVSVNEPKPFSYVILLETDAVCVDNTVVNPAYPKGSLPSYLESLMAKCIFLNKGWWTYKFCYEKSIKQFHAEKIKTTIPGEGPETARIETITTDNFLLGNWQKDSPAIHLVKGSSPALSYLLATYTGGSPCDLTMEPRRSEVRFFCNKDAEGARFASVKETSTCVYLVEIETPTLCKHPDFVVHQPSVHEIICRPEEEPAVPVGNLKVTDPANKVSGSDSIPVPTGANEKTEL